MCELFSGQDPRRYTSVRRSLRLRGFVTSLSLEQYFWEVLDALSAEQAGPPHSECIADKRHKRMFAPAANLLFTIRLCPSPT